MLGSSFSWFVILGDVSWERDDCLASNVIAYLRWNWANERQTVERTSVGYNCALKLFN
jgi:hypothetical protein